MSKGVGSEIKLLGKHSSIYGMANVLNRIVSFILLPVYTHYLDPADYGVLDLLYFTTAFVGIVLDMGITAAMGRFYFDSDDQKDRNLVVATAFYGFGIGSSVLIMMIIAGSGFLSEMIFKESGYGYLMALALVGLGIDMYIKVAYTYLRVRQRSLVLMLVSVSRLILQLSLNILFVVILEMKVEGILLGIIISNVALVAFLLPYVLRETGMRYSWPKLKEMIRYGLPLIPSNFMAYMVNVSDRYFVTAFQGLHATGLYTLGYRFGILVNEFAASPFGQIWLPRRYETYKRPDAERVFGRIFTYFTLCVSFVGLGISVITKDVIQIMSDEAYWDAYQVVPIIVLSYIIAGFNMHVNFGMLIQKKTKYIMYINVSTAIINLALNYFLIRDYGIWGAAYATLFSFALKITLTYFISNRLLRINVEWGRMAKILIVGLGLFWPLSMIETGQPIVNAVIKAVGCLFFPGILYVIRFFEPGEISKGWALVRDVLGKFLPRFRNGGNGPTGGTGADPHDR